MIRNVIAVFDIGKTNKKILLFDEGVNVVFQEEQKFEEITDDDGFACDDIAKIESWMNKTIEDLCTNKDFNIKAVNFTTYGASLVYLDVKGRRLTPVYNYLKPMPEEVMDGFYQKYGGPVEFTRTTASPALEMLNSGLQILWLKKMKPDVFCNVKSILHFPQYLCHYFTGKISSEYTSIGCHTAMWDFNKMKYHKWLNDESIHLPPPIGNSTTYDVQLKMKPLKVGIGIHDSSSSLVPYLKNSDKQFMLLSTGTWCILMNPFNSEALTLDQLQKDTLCYLSVQQRQVKSSRLFLGHIHDVNATRISAHFNLPDAQYRKTKFNEELIKTLLLKNKNKRQFFIQGIPEDYIDTSIDLSVFTSYEEAYHQLIIDLTDLGMDSLKLITPGKDNTSEVYVSGGFARNDIFLRMLATRLKDKTVYTSEIDNSSALGAALVVWNSAFDSPLPNLDLGLNAVLPIKY
jgi:sugar (pentulose or hexulose) kinase